MRLRGLLHIVALGCLLASAPIAVLKYPWLPPTVMEFADLQHDPAPWGIPSCHIGRAQRSWPKLSPWWAELAAWSVIAVTGLGIALFDRPSMPGTNPAYVFMTVYLPLGIAVIATVALVITFATRFSTRMNR